MIKRFLNFFRRSARPSQSMPYTIEEEEHGNVRVE